MGSFVLMYVTLCCNAFLTAISSIAAMQHQDGGIYSVNIALNSHKDEDGNGFSGGGTFFEGLTDDEAMSSIQRPVAPGHAVFHHTTARHAGVSLMPHCIVSLPS